MALREPGPLQATAAVYLRPGGSWPGWGGLFLRCTVRRQGYVRQGVRMYQSKTKGVCTCNGGVGEREQGGVSRHECCSLQHSGRGWGSHLTALSMGDTATCLHGTAGYSTAMPLLCAVTGARPQKTQPVALDAQAMTDYAARIPVARSPSRPHSLY